MKSKKPSFQETQRLILSEIQGVLESVEKEEIEALVDAIIEARRVFVIGVGRVLLSLQMMAKRLFHLGISIHVVGDVTEPAAGSSDLIIVGSGSGGSIVPVAVAKRAKELGAKVFTYRSEP